MSDEERPYGSPTSISMPVVMVQYRRRLVLHGGDERGLRYGEDSDVSLYVLGLQMLAEQLRYEMRSLEGKRSQRKRALRELSRMLERVDEQKGRVER